MDSVSVSEPNSFAPTDLASTQNTNPNSSSSLSPERQTSSEQKIEKPKSVSERGVAVFSITDQTSLHDALETGDTKTAATILEKGASTDWVNEDGQNALAKAANSGSLDAVRLLLDRGVRCTSYDALIDGSLHSSLSPLVFALKSDSDDPYEILKVLIENGGRELLNTPIFKNNGGDKMEDLASPLHAVAEYSNPSVLKLFIENGADANKTDSKGRTLLHKAAYGGNIEMTKCLLNEQSMDKNVTDNNGRTPLLSAVRSHEKSAVEVVQLLVKNYSVDVNTRDNEGYSVLHVLFQYSFQNKEVIQQLVESGADINATDKNNRTPIHHAALKTMMPSLIDWLVEQGADINAQDKDGKNALRLILQDSRARSNDMDLIYRMLANGGDYLLEDHYGKCFTDDLTSPISRTTLCDIDENEVRLKCDFLASLLKEHQDKRLNRVTDTWASILKEMCCWPEEGVIYEDIGIIEENDRWRLNQITWIVENPQEIHQSSPKAEALLKVAATAEHGGPYWGMVKLLLEEGVEDCLNDSQRQEFFAHLNIDVSDSKPEDIQKYLGALTHTQPHTLQTLAGHAVSNELPSVSSTDHLPVPTQTKQFINRSCIQQLYLDKLKLTQ